MKIKQDKYHLHQNARISIITEPLWAIFGTAAIYYLALYMKTVGLSNIQIGLLLSINLYIACVIQVFAGVITNKLGRKPATFYFDVAAWVIPMFIWAVSNNFWLFLLGFILNAASKVVNVSFWLLATEDTDVRYRSKVFASIKLIIMLAGVVVPLVGFAIEKFGAEIAFRFLFLMGGFAMLLHNIIRNHFSVETEAGKKAKAKHQTTNIFKGIIENGKLFAQSFKHKTLRPLVIMYVTSAIAFQFNLFQVIYMSDILGFSDIVVGLVPAVIAIVGVLLYLFMLPRLNRTRKLGVVVFYSALLTCLGWALFIFVSPEQTMFLFFSVALVGGGTFLLESFRDSLVVSSVHEEERADLFSAVQSVTAILAIPVGVLSALLYDQEPKFLFGTIFLLYVISAISVFIIRNKEPIKNRLL